MLNSIKYFFFILVLMASCKESSNSKSEKSKIDYNIALEFINEYNKEFFNPTSGSIDWLTKSKYASKNLIENYKQLQHNAEIADPELGLDFDPILDGQDSDEKGFEIKKIDSINNYVIVRGKSLQDYEITIKLIENNGNTLVEGAGVLNILKSKLKK
ncbi:hypothetical protein ABXT06_04225 [Flavobacterium sp. UW10123]|uniref:hypothetical protein n=1 Tax=Flavobacterium sp. UW10123 TaxID=3230800 RepID=UPI003395B806